MSSLARTRAATVRCAHRRVAHDFLSDVWFCLDCPHESRSHPQARRLHHVPEYEFAGRTYRRRARTEVGA
jgi:hypothetical protein